MRLVIAATLAAAALLGAAPAVSHADPAKCDVYNRTCYPQYCYTTHEWVGPFSGYCPDIYGPPYGRGNGRDAG